MTTTTDRPHRRTLGKQKSTVRAAWPFRLYRALFGAEDMHSHYRWNAVRPLIEVTSASTLEVGGGDGRISFQVADEGHTGPILITEFDPKTLAEARAQAESGKYPQVSVSQQDLRDLAVANSFHQVLAIDVLEHIEDDLGALRQIAEVTEPGGRLVISVPTPRYPLVFGRAFHESIGHVRDGYSLPHLTGLLDQAGFDLVTSRHYAGRWVSRAAKLFYGARIPYVFGVLWAPLARPLLMRTEKHVDPAYACSLAVVARRR